MRLLLAFSLFAAAGPLTAKPIGSVAAVNAPLAYIAETLGGGSLEVVYPVPEGVDPAYWRPTVEEALLYQTADLILLNGAGYAKWTETHALPRARLVDTTAEVVDLLLPSDDTVVVHRHGPEGEHSHGSGFAITTWLDPQIAKAQVAAAQTAIEARFPWLATDIAVNAEALLAEIDEMDAAFARFFADVSERQIIGSHPVYQYLDRAYPSAIAAVHWEPDAMPAEAEWEAFAANLDPSRAPIMLWEDAPLVETRQRLEAMGVEVQVLNPLANAANRESLFQTIGAQVNPK